MRPGRPSLTARWVAAWRAKLSATRPATATGNPDAEVRLLRSMGWFFTLPGTKPDAMTLRTRFIDSEVVRALGAGVTQIVIVGAGYDGRALRFGGGATRFFEVDFPSTQADKQQRLEQLGIEVDNVAYVGVDLITGDLDAGLAFAQHDVSAPSVFILEGLLTYLPLETIADVFKTLRARAAEGSTLVVSFRVHPVRERTSPLTGAFFAAMSAIGEARRMEFHPGDLEKLCTVTGWHPVRSERAAANKLDGGSSPSVMAAAPA
jgi:methyltransferase (TIGR00027 family)